MAFRSSFLEMRPKRIYFYIPLFHNQFNEEISFALDKVLSISPKYFLSKTKRVATNLMISLFAFNRAQKSILIIAKEPRNQY